MYETKLYHFFLVEEQYSRDYVQSYHLSSKHWQNQVAEQEVCTRPSPVVMLPVIRSMVILKYD